MNDGFVILDDISLTPRDEENELFNDQAMNVLYNCDVQLLISPIWKPISSFVMQNKSYTCCMLKLGLFKSFLEL
jgi:hypothetical protein